MNVLAEIVSFFSGVALVGVIYLCSVLVLVGLLWMIVVIYRRQERQKKAEAVRQAEMKASADMSRQVSRKAWYEDQENKAIAAKAKKSPLVARPIPVPRRVVSTTKAFASVVGMGTTKKEDDALGSPMMGLAGALLGYELGRLTAPSTSTPNEPFKSGGGGDFAGAGAGGDFGSDSGGSCSSGDSGSSSDSSSGSDSSSASSD